MKLAGYVSETAQVLNSSHPTYPNEYFGSSIIWSHVLEAVFVMVFPGVDRLRHPEWRNIETVSKYYIFLDLHYVG